MPPPRMEGAPSNTPRTGLRTRSSSQSSQVTPAIGSESTATPSTATQTHGSAHSQGNPAITGTSAVATVTGHTGDADLTAQVSPLGSTGGGQGVVPQPMDSQDQANTGQYSQANFEQVFTTHEQLLRDSFATIMERLTTITQNEQARDTRIDNLTATITRLQQQQSQAPMAPELPTGVPHAAPHSPGTQSDPGPSSRKEPPRFWQEPGRSSAHDVPPHMPYTTSRPTKNNFDEPRTAWNTRLSHDMPYYDHAYERARTAATLLNTYSTPMPETLRAKAVEPPKPSLFRAKDDDDVEAFLHQLLSVMNLTGQDRWPDKQRIHYSSTFLRGDAQNWYLDLVRQRDHPYLRSFPHFVEGMISVFGQVETPEYAASKLMSLRQSKMSVRQYYMEFSKWLQRAHWDTIAANHRFKSGLAPYILQRLNARGHHPTDLHETYRLAQLIEKEEEVFSLTYPQAQTYADPAYPRRKQQAQLTSSNTNVRQPELQVRDITPKAASGEAARPAPKALTAGTTTTSTALVHQPRQQSTAYRPRNARMESAQVDDQSSAAGEDTSRPTGSSNSPATSLYDDAQDFEDSEEYDDTVYTVDDRFTPQDPATSTADNNWSPTDTDRPAHHDLNMLLARAQSSGVIYTPILLPSSPRTPLRALVDSGASLNFIDPALCNSLGLPIVMTDDVPDIALGDGRTAPIKHFTLLTVLPGEGFEAYTDQFYVFPIGKPGLILGTPFFRSHKPVFDWENLRIIPQNPLRTLENLRSMVPSDRHRDLLLPLREPDKGPEVILGQLPDEFSEFSDVFSEDLAEQLPKHSQFDHDIVLLPDTVPRYGPVYKTSEPQAKYLHDYILDNLRRGWIRPSKSSWSSPVLFAAKKDGSMRMCIDYRYVNSRTQKVRYPLPRIDQIIDKLYKARYFSKIDLRNAYNLVRIKKGDEHITAFRTQEGLFEYTVMPFGLCNAPATFQRLMNHVFRDILYVFVVVYLDDILIFSNDRDDHVRHIREVFTRLRRFRLYAKASKCEFFSRSISFLGYYIDFDGISMDPSKVQCILDWPYPRRQRDILSFVGLANFYRTLIPAFADAAEILYESARPKKVFALTPELIDAWDTFKRILSSNTIVRHFDPSLPCIIEADASDYAIGAVLSQTENGTTRPVAFLSRKMKPAELNYPTHDKELLAIVYALQSWAHYLEGHQITIKIYSDHQSLKFFAEKKLLSRRQAAWQDTLSRFDFVIHYNPGKNNTKADVLSRRADYLPDDTDSTSKSKELNPHNELALLPPELFLGVMRLTPVNAATALPSLLKEAHDAISTAERAKLGIAPNNGFLQREGLIYVPPSLVDTICASCHEPPSMGHPGVKKTTQNVRALYWWPTLTTDVEHYVRQCEVCQRTKPTFGKPYGFLKPLPVASRPWQHVACDFVGPLPMSSGYNFVLTAVDRFTKMAIFAPCSNDISSFQFAELFVDRVCHRFGLPSTLVTDRGPQFTSKVWQCIASIMGITHRLSTAYHPQTDGQSEIVNKVLGQYLRVYSNLEQNDWASKLSAAEFCYNSTPHSATGLSPLQAYTGYNPRRSLDELPSSTTTTTLEVPKATTMTRRMNVLHKHLQTALNDANERYAGVYNAKRRDVRFEEGDWVWLNTKNLRTLRPSKKLDNRFAGPYQIEKVINELAYRLRLEDHSSLGRTFHVDLLKPFVGKPPVEPTQPALAYATPVPVRITAHRTVRDQPQWKVHWSSDVSAWETDESMQSYDNWPSLRDSFVPTPRPRRRRAKAEDDTPWKGWKWTTTEDSPHATEDSSSKGDHRSDPLLLRSTTPNLPRLRPRPVRTQ